jgi:lipopolysaccharide/colanic/teichoic acid biosynthesis glycosyltransferase
MIKRIFDIVSSTIVLLLLLPFLFIIAAVVLIESRGGIFYTQKRVGRGNKDFLLYKFRTMFTGSDQKGLLTVGANDSRITRSGKFLRKLKLDEIPQLLNVILGDMSVVGPRPEVRKYVDYYSSQQMKVLDVRPGLTDPASLTYINENDILAAEKDAEQYYLQVIMPHKLELNLNYLSKQNFCTDLRIIFRTLQRLFL